MACDGLVRMTLDVERPPDAPSAFWCRVRVTNMSKHSILVLEDPQLPKAHYLPTETCRVFFGVSPIEYREEPSEAFAWCEVKSGQDHVYAFQVNSPMRENPAYYGNPIYDDPDSQYYDRRPARLVWKDMVVDVGYIVLDDPATAGLMRTVAELDGSLVLPYKGQEYVAVCDMQRIVSVHVANPGE